MAESVMRGARTYYFRKRFLQANLMLVDGAMGYHNWDPRFGNGKNYDISISVVEISTAIKP